VPGVRNRRRSTELAPFELAGRLALAFGLAVFLGLAFEEVYKRQERSRPGGVRTFPMLALAGAMLYLIEPQHALAFIVGLFALAVWGGPWHERPEKNCPRRRNELIAKGAMNTGE
jgi:hypothetical protein